MSVSLNNSVLLIRVAVLGLKPKPVRTNRKLI